MIVLFLAVSFLAALVFWLGALYLSLTERVPESGGRYSEGVVGQPRYVNPVLSPANTVDEDIVSLVYGGLMGYDTDGKAVERLADRLEVSEDGKTYTAHIRDGALWHDGEPVTAEDVTFTVSVIQDAAFKSPLRQKWQGIEASASDDRTVVFTLKKPYFGFREHLTVGILPKHAWQDVSSDRFALTELNLTPIGSGPYRFFDYEKDVNGNILSYELRAFEDYPLGEPHITKFAFGFYPDEDAMIEAYGRREVLGMSPLSSEKGVPFLEKKGVTVHSFHLPRVFAVFFNPVKSVPLAYAEVRQALTLAVDRDALVRDALSGRGLAASSPFLPFMAGGAETPHLSTDRDAANRQLDEAGWVRADDGIRKKGDVRLAFTLFVPDWPELRTTADRLHDQWAEIGAAVDVRVESLADLHSETIRPREYEALLYGEAMSIDPDFYSFWHSDEKSDPGLNLALFDEDRADEILFSLREESDAEKRRSLTNEFLGLIAARHPAAFLYTPDVLYVMSDSVKGWEVGNANNMASRFSGAERWYVDTKRVFRHR